MKSISRKKLKKTNLKYYKLLEKSGMLDELYPLRKTNCKGNKKILEDKFFKKGIKPSKPKHIKEFNLFQSYRTSKHSSYDKKWINLMYKKYPFLKLTRKDKSFKKMLSLMHKDVKFKKGQVWKGTQHKYIFIHKKYGEFTSKVSYIQRAWERGNSGNKKDSMDKLKSILSKKIKCSNNKIYNSLTEAANKLKLHVISIKRSIKENRTLKGYKFEYIQD